MDKGLTFDRAFAMVIGTFGIIALARGDLALGLVDVGFAVAIWLVENRSEDDTLYAQLRWWPYVRTGVALLLLCATLLVTLAARGPAPLTLSDTPPASTFQTPPPRATDYPLARPGATAQIRGTVTP